MSKGPNPHNNNPLLRGDPYVGVTVDGRFRIGHLVGTGGMGRVYRAIQIGLNRAVALKILDPPHTSTVTDSLRQRFLAEAEMTANLRHPNTVTVIDYGTTDAGTLYIAFEFLEGRTLAQVLSAENALPWPRVLHIAQQVARSLRQAHSKGIVHRDLKPANIMLLDVDSEADFIKVLDFGLVKAFANYQIPSLSKDVTQAGMLVGSPTYMSPEQGQSSQADPRSDLYALGIVMFECLCGSPPFLGASPIEVILKHINQPVPPLTPPPHLPPLPTAVENLVMRCLAKQPEFRPASMDEFLSASQLLFASLPSSPSSPYLPIIEAHRHISSPPHYVSSPPHYASAPPHYASSPPHYASAPPHPAPRPIPLRALTPPTEDALPPQPENLEDDCRSTLSFFADGPPPSPLRFLWPAALFLGLAAAAFAWWMLRTPTPAPHLSAFPVLPPPPILLKYNAPEELFLHAVSSSPPGAMVFLNEVPQGVTPLEIQLPLSQANASFSFKMELEGFHTLEFQTLLGPLLAPVEKQLRPKPKAKPAASTARGPAPNTPLEEIPSMDLDDE